MAKGRKVFDMDATALRKFEKGDQITTGNPFPGLDDEEEIVWTATNAINGTRTCAKLGNREFRVVDFDLTYLGVLMGKIRATELDKNKIEWRAIT
jgi:hypothetical protein